MHTTEIFNDITTFGMPNHKLLLKVGIPIMMLRNIDHFINPCNGTWLIITNLGKHMLATNVITGSSTDKTVFIPCMNMTSLNLNHPFKL